MVCINHAGKLFCEEAIALPLPPSTVAFVVGLIDLCDLRFQRRDAPGLHERSMFLHAWLATIEIDHGIEL